jgi:uncharacterized protein (UPF0332 family)
MAQHLLASGESAFSRRVCGRAYYAAYALVTARLPDSLTFGRGWRNLAHAAMPAYVNHIRGLREDQRRGVRRALRRLRQRREDADYRPGITVGTADARESLRDMAEVFMILLPRAGYDQG